MIIICLESGQYWLVDVVFMFFYLSFKYEGNNLLKNSHYSWYNYYSSLQEEFEFCCYFVM